MGLDMCACKTRLRIPKVDLKVRTPVIIHTWRKHPAMHYCTENLYWANGGRVAWFNCANLRLTLYDLDRLAWDIASGNLPKTEPDPDFFARPSTGCEWANDTQFVITARHAISEGYRVFYQSWW